MSANEKAELIFIIIKRIGKWILYAFIIILLIFLCILAYDKINNYLEKLPKVITEFKGIKIGEKYSDLIFRNPGFKEKKVVKFKAASEIYYEHDEKRLTVSLTKGKVDNIYYSCDQGLDYTIINGISCNDSGDKIIEKFADEIRIQCNIDKTGDLYPNVRVYDIIKYGVRYYVINNIVSSISITSPDSLASYIGFNWGSCE